MGNRLKTEPRVDPYLGSVVHVVQSRQARPNRPSIGCPFCVGGLEAPEPYEVKAFPNRWPALGAGRCEVVLYTPEHQATFASLGVVGARKVIDLWADRTAALRSIEGVEFVLVFENRGGEVGATIEHPHGQIYAYDHVPSRPLRRFTNGWLPETDCGDRLVSTRGGWTASAQYASVHPLSLSISHQLPFADLGQADGATRDGLAAMLVDTFGRLDRLYNQPLPYMMWLNQEPSNWDGEPVWFNIEIISPWRAVGVSRFIAAAEVACEEYFNPVDPADIAQRLRALA